MTRYYDYGDEDNKIYSGVSTFGVIMADIKVVFGSIIGLILIIIGIAFVIKKSVRVSTVIGNVKSPNCIEVINNNNLNFNCTFTVDYTINNIKNTKQFTDYNSSKIYKDGDTVTLWYDPNNINNIDIQSDNLHITGWILITFGIILIFSTILIAYLSNKYKPFAFAEGVYSGVNMIR